jgi:hypothetical protein
MLIFFIATSCAEHPNNNDWQSARLIYVKGFRWPEGASSKQFNGTAI